MPYTREQIDNILRTNDRAVERAILRLFELQTADEQKTAGTNQDNGRGFRSSDARAGTRFARWLLGMNDRNQVKYAKKLLTNPKADRIFINYCRKGERVIDRARRIALTHSRQLVAIANEKEQSQPTREDVQRAELCARAKSHLAAIEASCTEDTAPGQTLAERGFTFDGPQPGTWAYTARMMAEGDDSGFDWDAWKDEMKDRDLGVQGTCGLIDAGEAYE